MEKNQFKPFDKVLVKESKDSVWKIELYSHSYQNLNGTFHVCVGHTWRYCIPYNEETKHLLGTTKDYQKPEQKEYHIWTSGTFNEWMTESEFKNFIETAVIHNKDITDFHVLRIKQ